MRAMIVVRAVVSQRSHSNAKKVVGPRGCGGGGDIVSADSSPSIKRSSELETAIEKTRLDHGKV